MLKLILQHWQNNRQKVYESSIFPELFEPDQPITRINPIYQDTESSGTKSDTPSPPAIRRGATNTNSFDSSEIGGVGPVLTNVVAEIHSEPTLLHRRENVASTPSTSGISSSSTGSDSVKTLEEILEDEQSVPKTDDTTEPRLRTSRTAQGSDESSMTRNKNLADISGSPLPANKSALHSSPDTHAILAKAISSTIMGNNLNLKPSEVVKRQKELLKSENNNTQPKVAIDPPVLVIPPPPPLSTIEEVEDTTVTDQL